MNNEINAFYDRLDQIRLQFNEGDIYKNMPELIIAARTNLDRKKRRTAYKAPESTAANLAQMAALAKKYRDRVQELKNADEKDADKEVPQDLDDKELDFLLDQLGNPDPRMRDHGSFYVFNDILRTGVLNDDQFHYAVAVTSSPEYLFPHIRESESDALFRRSFAVLVMGTLLFADRNFYHTLTEGEILVLLHRLATYALLEEDGRGFIENKGWGHAWIHVGNVFDELIERNLTRADKIFLMTAIVLGYQQVRDPLVYGEDQRLAFSLSNLVNKETFYADYLLLLLKQWQGRLMSIRPRDSVTFWNRWYNRNRLLEAMILRGDFPDSINQFLNDVTNNY